MERDKKEARVVAVCTSQEKGSKKKDIAQGFLKKGYGLLGDAHSDSSTHRQVSLLALESIHKMQELGLKVGPGDFAENLTTRGIDLLSLPLGTRLFIGEKAILEVTQIGKECHTPCAIYYQAGRCVMPEEGIFTKVLQGGEVKAGDKIVIIK